MARKLYGNTITTTQARQEILTAQAVGLDENLPNLVKSVKNFQIINDSQAIIRIQINDGDIVPLIAGSGIDMGNEWVNSCVVHTQGAKVTYACQR